MTVLAVEFRKTLTDTEEWYNPPTLSERSSVRDSVIVYTRHIHVWYLVVFLSSFSNLCLFVGDCCSEFVFVGDFCCVFLLRFVVLFLLLRFVSLCFFVFLLKSTCNGMCIYIYIWYECGIYIYAWYVYSMYICLC